jgi:predicted RNase H-like nuclease (RuvC/YqgF family)
LEALKADFNGYQENVEDKFLHVQAELLDRIEKYDKLNKKYMTREIRLAELQEFERKGNEEEVLKADLAAKKIEVRTLKVKFDKEREKVKQLTKKLEVSENNICISMHFGFNNQFIQAMRTRPIFQKF